MCIVRSTFSGSLSLRTASGSWDAIRDIAEVFYQRAEMLIQDWEDRHNSQGPVLDDDSLAGMVQEIIFLDISDFSVSPNHESETGFTGKPVESIAGEVCKEAVLEFVDE